MAANYLARHLIIQRLAEENRNKLMVLWEQLAIEIISIIGEKGFISLYKRSEFLAHKTFSWLPTHSQADQTKQLLLQLKTRLESQPFSEAYQANLLLLNIFTDTLALLIGEQLALRILNSAWDIDPSITSNLELKNE